MGIKSAANSIRSTASNALHSLKDSIEQSRIGQKLFGSKGREVSVAESEGNPPLNKYQETKPKANIAKKTELANSKIQIGKHHRPDPWDSMPDEITIEVTPETKKSNESLESTRGKIDQWIKDNEIPYAQAQEMVSSAKQEIKNEEKILEGLQKLLKVSTEAPTQESVNDLNELIRGFEAKKPIDIMPSKNKSINDEIEMTKKELDSAISIKNDIDQGNKKLSDEAVGALNDIISNNEEKLDHFNNVLKLERVIEVQDARIQYLNRELRNIQY